MNTVKILHCADVHIGAEESFLGVKAESRRRETLLTFEKIVDLCLENKAQLLLISGDLFHTNNVENSFVQGVVQKIKTAPHLKVIYAAGNHDPLNPRSPFAKVTLPENLYILNGEEGVFFFEELGVRVYGRSFETAFLEGKTVPDLIPPEDEIINISLIHGELTSDMSSRYNPISKQYIESSKMDYIALGHVHKRSDIARLGNTYFAYSGCPEGQGFDELGEKGVYLGEIGKGYCDLKFVPTAKRQHIFEKIYASNITADSILNLLAEKYENYEENLYKIELTGSVAEDTVIDLADITARLNEKLYYAKVKDSTTTLIDLEALSKEQSLKGIFVKRMLEKIETAEEKEAMDLALKLGLQAFSGEVKFDEN